ncbi:MAG TPA: FAD-dependent monooxygenase [Bryobacteraceae bacterium]|nr:FAD-dependent monooxygenase [Bryobacteraceae bacterium]
MGQRCSVVRVLGAGPAGCAAAIQALSDGTAVEIFEKSLFPRHKVCGEFMSPETMRLLEEMGIAAAVGALRAPPIRRMLLSFKGREKHGKLPEAAFGLSRYALDDILLRRVAAMGAVVRREKGAISAGAIIATGRQSVAPKGRRLFGFKAHFTGPANDAVELYFIGRRGYVGVNAVEGGATNVCGLAEEAAMREVGFNVDDFLYRDPSLRRRLSGLSRRFPWLTSGPLIFNQRFGETPQAYPAGDCLSFIDPFTGSGILSALLTGKLAGRAASAGSRSLDYISQCQRTLRVPFQVASLFRTAVDAGWAEWAAPWIPARVLFRLTRPRMLSGWKSR